MPHIYALLGGTEQQKFGQDHYRWWQRSIPDTVLCWNTVTGYLSAIS